MEGSLIQGQLSRGKKNSKLMGSQICYIIIVRGGRKRFSLFALSIFTLFRMTFRSFRYSAIEIALFFIRANRYEKKYSIFLKNVKKNITIND